MKINPLVSIIITNYNKSKFIIKAVESCLSQKYSNIEIIFYDDGSTDDSLEKIKKFKRKKNIQNLKIFNNCKKKKLLAVYSHIEAVKKSLKYSKGKYIFLLDSDDFFHNNKIKKITRIFAKDNSKKIVFDRPIFTINEKKFKKKINYQFIKNKWPKFPPTSCMSFERKKLIKTVNKINIKRFPNLAIDFRLAVYYSLVENKFFLTSSYLTFYRQVEGSMDSKYKKFRSKHWWERRFEAFKFLNLILNKNNLPIHKSLDYTLTRVINKFFQ